MNPFESTAKAIWPDVQQWVVDKHLTKMEGFYKELFNDYLDEKFGTLDTKARERIIKNLIKQIIT